MLKVAGADTLVPFSSMGAKLIGTYSATTNVNVSNLGATNVNQFVITTPQSNTYYHPNVANGDRSMIITVTAGSLSLSNGTLTVRPATVTAAAYTKWGSDWYNIGWGSASDTLPVSVYYVGSVT